MRNFILKFKNVSTLEFDVLPKAHWPAEAKGDCRWTMVTLQWNNLKFRGAEKFTTSTNLGLNLFYLNNYIIF